jgi:hypothetical protein
MPHETATVGRNRAERDSDAELDALVAAEFAHLQPQVQPEVARPATVPRVTTPAEESIEVELDRLARRLRGHPNCAALIERLRAASLGDGPAAAEALTTAVTAEAIPPRNPE